MSSAGEHFPGIGKIKYEGPETDNPLAFKWYNADEEIMGKTMKEHLRFSVCYWHTFRGGGNDPFGTQTLFRPWDDYGDSVENAKRRLDAAFEFFVKLGNPYWTFHDRDVAPEGRDLAETNAILDEVTDYAAEKMKETGVKLLWGTANMFTHPRYMNGAGTNPELDVFAHAAAQVKKAMEVTAKLGGENYVFWGGREGYMSVLNTDVRRELDHAANLFRMAVAHKKDLGHEMQLLIEPKPREPTKHQYDYDAQTVIGFLHHYGLQDHFKINVEPNHTTLAGHDFEHDLNMSSRYGMLGSVDSNTGDPLLGWDTDQFPMDFKDATLAMLIIVNQGGLAPGGLNFDCKVRRESTDLDDMFISHVGAMDTFAKGLRNAEAILREGKLPAMVADRYSTWDSALGKEVEADKCTLAKLEAHALKRGEITPKSGKQELYERVFQGYL